MYDEKDIKELDQLHVTRFPSLDKIREVYNALVNFLQIPSYTGEYTSFDFQFNIFIRNFKLKARETLYALKALEQDGWFVFNEKYYSPSTLVFNYT